MDFDSEPLPGVINEAIVKLDVVQPLGEHTATIIFLHGSGDEGRNFVDFATELSHGRPDLKHLKWILPTAKSRLCSANGLTFPLWFDILHFRDLSAGPWDEQGLLESVEAIHGLVRHEITVNGIPASRIVLGGLSQGSATAVWSSLTFSDATLAGTCALAGRLPAPDLLQTRLSRHIGEQYPIFVAHMDADPTVPLHVGSDKVVKFLKETVGVKTSYTPGVGLNYTVRTGRLHYLVADPDTWAAVGRWLSKVLPEEGTATKS